MPSSKPRSSFKTLSSIVNSELSHKRLDFAQLSRLQNIWQQSLPETLASHSKVAALNENELIVYADSPVWANKLANNRQKILETIQSKELGKKCAEIKYLRIQVDPSTSIISKKIKKLKGLSELASKYLSSAAAEISDPELRQALLKLSRQTKQTDENHVKKRDS